MAADYVALKGKILVRCGLPPTNAAAEFHKWSYHPGVALQAQMDSVLCTSMEPEPSLSPVSDLVGSTHNLQGNGPVPMSSADRRA